MPYNRAHVRDFLSATEIPLFESSLGADLKALGPAELQRRIKRARALRDKNRDLLRRQKLQTRARTGSKSGVSGHANERTAKKATAFDEALKRFEAQARNARTAPAKKTTATKKATTAKKAAAKKTTPAKKATVAKKATPAKTTPAKKATAKKATVEKATVEKAPMAAKKAAPVKKATASKKAVATKQTSASEQATRPRRARPRSEPGATTLRRALEAKQAALAARTEAGAATARSAKAPSQSPIAGLDGLGPTPPSVRAAVVESRQEASNLKPIQGHTSTQVRAAQAKRDQRG